MKTCIAILAVAVALVVLALIAAYLEPGEVAPRGPGGHDNAYHDTQVRPEAREPSLDDVDWYALRTATRNARRPSRNAIRRSSSCSLEAIRQLEAGGRYNAVSSSGKYRGAYQFDQRTWESVGGTGDPASAPPAEQDARAAELMRRRGTQPWSAQEQAMKHVLVLRMTIEAPTALAALRCIAEPVGRIEGVEDVVLLNPSGFNVPVLPTDPTYFDEEGRATDA